VTASASPADPARQRELLRGEVRRLLHRARLAGVSFEELTHLLDETRTGLEAERREDGVDTHPRSETGDSRE
jgi:hypothetical protein